MKTGKLPLVSVLLLLVLSVVLAVISCFPVSGVVGHTDVVIDDSFRLTPKETYRQGLGSFRGNENITILINQIGDRAINFTLLTYNGPRYSNASASDIVYSFPAGADYYEAVFLANDTSTNEVRFQVSVTRSTIEYPFYWLGTPAKALFLISWAATVLLILKSTVNISNPFENVPKMSSPSTLQRKNYRRLQIAILVSLLFWLVLLLANTYPLATFENWYTDSARHPYTSVLFTKVGFSVFDTPLGMLSSADGSNYKFVTWAEMPNLYPIGSVLLFLPFGALLEGGAMQGIIFKFENAMLLVVAHCCLYLFLKHFWSEELGLAPRKFFLKLFRKVELWSALKVVATYILYIVLIVYAANGQFDGVAFLFALIGVIFFLMKRYDLLLLAVAISCTFKYQAGIFLLPLTMLSVVLLLQKSTSSNIFRNKAILAAIVLGAFDLFTACLSAPFLISVRPELIMNGVNAFSPHAQISWPMQTFAVLLTLTVTLASAVYLLNKNRLSSLFAIFTLLPAFMMPYFQPWYLPFFFIYPLIPQSKRSLEVTLIWLIFVAIVLAFGGLAYNPLTILDNIRKILKF